MNLVILKGNLTRDPELRPTPRGSVCDINIAVNETWTDDSGNRHEKVTFVHCTYWGRQGEAVAKYFHKGKPILVTGKLSQDTWDDKQTGQKRHKTFVSGQQWEFAGGKEEGRRMKDEGEPARAPMATQEPDMTQGMGDDDIPF